MQRDYCHRILAYVVSLISIAMTCAAGAEEGKVEGILVELSTFIAHGDIDDWGRTAGISCVVTNRSARRVTVQRGYDGKANLLVSRTGHFPIGLFPIGDRLPTVSVEVEPGLSETIFTLPMHGILLRGGEANLREWHWGWVYQIPRGAPPRSPIHPSPDLGWQAMLADKVALEADVSIGNIRVKSAPFHYRLRLPHAKAAKPLDLQVVVDGDSIIKGSDIISYHLPSHSLRIRDGVLDDLRKKYAKQLARGVPFSLKIGGRELYDGMLVTVDTQRSFATPVLRLDASHTALIEYGYRLGTPPATPDPRENDRFREALINAGILLQ